MQNRRSRLGDFPPALDTACRRKLCPGCGLIFSALLVQGQAGAFNSFELLLATVPLGLYGIFSVYRAKVNPKAKLGAPCILQVYALGCLPRPFLLLASVLPANLALILAGLCAPAVPSLCGCRALAA